LFLPPLFVKRLGRKLIDDVDRNVRELMEALHDLSRVAAAELLDQGFLFEHLPLLPPNGWPLSCGRA